MIKLPTTKHVITSLFLVSVVGTAPAILAMDYCTPYSAQFTLEGSSPYGPLNGGGVYTIGDQLPQPAQVAAVLNGSAKFDPFSTTNEVTFSSMALFAPGADGSLNILTGIDQAMGSATGPGTFVGETKSRITGGTGQFQDVTGKATSTSSTTVDLATGFTVSTISVDGRICGIGEAGRH